MFLKTARTIDYTSVAPQNPGHSFHQWRLIGGAVYCVHTTLTLRTKDSETSAMCITLQSSQELLEAEEA